MVLSKVPFRSTCGSDGLPQILFKLMSRQLTKPPVLLFRQLLLIGQLPDIWKIATVTPLFKNGSSSDPGNYRPISVTSLCCKIFESAIKKPLMEYFISNDFISFSQHGFLATRSTCTNLIEVLNVWNQNMDKRSDTLVPYIDFAKAFDSVSIPKLLLKLSHLGIGGKLLSCIHSFLSNR